MQHADIDVRHRFSNLDGISRLFDFTSNGFTLRPEKYISRSGEGCPSDSFRAQIHQTGNASSVTGSSGKDAQGCIERRGQLHLRRLRAGPQSSRPTQQKPSSASDVVDVVRTQSDQSVHLGNLVP